jgi:hypothetical protein
MKMARCLLLVAGFLLLLDSSVQSNDGPPPKICDNLCRNRDVHIGYFNNVGECRISDIKVCNYCTTYTGCKPSINDTQTTAECTPIIRGGSQVDLWYYPVVGTCTNVCQTNVATGLDAVEATLPASYTLGTHASAAVKAKCCGGVDPAS